MFQLPPKVQALEHGDYYLARVQCLRRKRALVGASIEVADTGEEDVAVDAKGRADLNDLSDRLKL